MAENQHKQNGGRGEKVDVSKVLKQEIQPDFDHLMSLFDKMKSNF